VTISERAAGRGFVLGNEGLGFLAILTADVGTAARQGFRVMLLQNPTRVVVDVQH